MDWKLKIILGTKQFISGKIGTRYFVVIKDILIAIHFFYDVSLSEHCSMLYIF